MSRARPRRLPRVARVKAGIQAGMGHSTAEKFNQNCQMVSDLLAANHDAKDFIGLVKWYANVLTQEQRDALTQQQIGVVLRVAESGLVAYAADDEWQRAFAKCAKHYVSFIAAADLHQAEVIYMRVLEAYQHSFKAASGLVAQLSTVELSLAAMQAYMTLRLRDDFFTEFTETVLQARLGAVFEQVTSVLALMRGHSAHDAACMSMQQTWLALAQQVVQLSAKRPLECPLSLVKAVIGPYRQQFLAFQAKPAYQAAREDLITTANLSRLKASGHTALLLAVSSEDMRLLPSMAYANAAKTKLHGDSAARLDWMQAMVATELDDADALCAQTTAVRPCASLHATAITVAQDSVVPERLTHLQHMSAVSRKSGLPVSIGGAGRMHNYASYEALLDGIANVHQINQAMLADCTGVGMTALALLRQPDGDVDPSLVEAVHQAASGRKVLFVDADLAEGKRRQRYLAQLIQRYRSSDSAVQRTIAENLRANLRYVHAQTASSTDDAGCMHAVDYATAGSARTWLSALQACIKGFVTDGFEAQLGMCMLGLDASRKQSGFAGNFEKVDYYNLLQLLPLKSIVVPVGGHNKAAIDEVMQAVINAVPVRAMLTSTCAKARSTEVACDTMAALLAASRHMMAKESGVECADDCGASEHKGDDVDAAEVMLALSKG